MNYRISGILLVLVFLFSAFSYAAPASLESYAALPWMSQPKLSDDGTQMIAFKPVNGTYHLYLLDLSSMKFRLLMAADPDRFLFNSCSWANHERVVCSIRSAINWRGLETKVFITNLIAVNTDGSKMMELIPPRKLSAAERGGSEVFGARKNMMALRNDTIINFLPGDDEHILISLAREKWNRPTVYKLNIYSNKMEKIERYQSGIFSWVTDQTGRVRVGVGLDGSVPTVKIRKKGEDKYHTLDLSQFDVEDLPVFRGFSEDGKTIYVASYNGADKLRLYAFDTETETLGELLASDPSFDVTGLIRSKEAGLIAAVYNADHTQYKWFNKAWEARFNAFKSAVPNHHVKLMSYDKSGEKFIFEVYGKGVNPAYYLFDAKKRSIVNFGGLYRGLQNEQVVAKQAVSYKSRDGVTIPAYLTLPQGVEKPYPTIILPHGGPIAREKGDFDYWSQFLSSRGYAVLQPNFRGSSGYGRDFMAAGYQQWGQTMQRDIIDGLQWMIDDKIADPNKTCIVGASYGGYAALVAAYQTPEYFKCAVSFAGVSDLRKLLYSLRYYSNGESATRKILDNVKGWSTVDDNSPIANVDSIDLPLLLIHGDEDSRVAVKQSQDLVSKLESAKSKKHYRYIEQEGGDHFLSLESHRLEFLTLMEGFLATHLN